MEEADDGIGALYEAYGKALRESGQYDFDDLIKIPLEILENREAGAGGKSMFGHVMVDEYQDINLAQYRLMRCLVSGKSNICAVGDSDQAIYAFRGADVGNFLNFDKDFPGADKVVLKRNYRSSKEILGAASGVIGHNTRRIDKELEAARQEGARISVISAPDERAEAEAIVGEIEARIGGTSHYGLMMGTPDRQLPEHSSGFGEFRLFTGPTPRRKLWRRSSSNRGFLPGSEGKGRDKIKEIVESLRKRVDESIGAVDFMALIGELCEATAITEDDRAELHQIVSAYGDLPPHEAMVAVMNELTLMSTGDSFDPRAEAVALMTLHMAKGLEFRVVFIAGVEGGTHTGSLCQRATRISRKREGSFTWA